MPLLDALRHLLGLSPKVSARPPAPIAPTWLQVPTLAPGGAFPVVGEASYQRALEQLAGGRHEDGTVVRWVTAVLEREPWNPHDRHAVRVVVGGEIVGYVPRQSTKVFRPALDDRLDPCTARARLTGGWDRGPADRGLIGIELDIASPGTVMSRDTPFLPAEQEVSLVGEEYCTPPQAGLGVPFTVLLKVADHNPMRPGAQGPFVLAMDGSGCIGWLSPTMAARYGAMVAEVSAAGIQPTASAITSTGAKNPQVKLMLPGTA